MAEFEYDRTDPDFVDAAIYQVFAVGVTPTSLVMPSPPSSFAELSDRVEQSRVGSCGITQEIDEMMDMISLDSNPDEIVRMLPFDVDPELGSSLLFILPDVDVIREKLKGE